LHGCAQIANTRQKRRIKNRMRYKDAAINLNIRVVKK
jgi:hypothetical protein